MKWMRLVLRKKYCKLTNSKDGNTLLHLSAKFLSMKLCSQLLKQGADPNLANEKGNTPLHEMVLFNFIRIKQVSFNFIVIFETNLDRK